MLQCWRLRGGAGARWVRSGCRLRQTRGLSPFRRRRVWVRPRPLPSRMSRFPPYPSRLEISSCPADFPVGNAASREPRGIGSTSLFPSAIETPAAVRRFVRDVTASRISDERADDVDLLVSEVVTNAVKYGGGDFVRVTVAERGPRVRVDVTDHSSEAPRVVRPSADRPGGRGMLLVDRIASRWGSEPIHGNGKVVWFER